MEEELKVTTPKALWLLIVVPPIILAAAMQANFVLVRQACSAQRKIALYAVLITGIVFIVTTALIAFAAWRVEGTRWPTEAADLPTRIGFVAVLGILSSVMSLLVLIAQGLAMIQLDPCQW